MATIEMKPITGADLKFKDFDLAKKLAISMLNTMMAEGYTKKADIPVVLNDLCKFVVLSEAKLSQEGALLVVQRFTELSTDLTCLMMRIVQGQTMEDFK